MTRHLQPIGGPGDRGNRVAAARRPLALFLRIAASGVHAHDLRRGMLHDGDAMGRPPGPGRTVHAPRADQVNAAHRVHNRLAAVPEDLGDLQAAVEAALAEPPHEALTALQVGVLFDAIPHGQARDDSVQLDAIVALVAADGFGPQVVARACDLILRTRHAIPSPAAFLEAARTAKAELESTLSALRTYRRLRARADELIALAASTQTEPTGLLSSPAESPISVPPVARRTPSAMARRDVPA